MATINTTDPKPGYVYDSDSDTWFPLLGLSVTALDDLTDVVITTPTSGQILAYNGTNWINQTETGDISALTSGTGISLTDATGPIPTVAVDTAVVATTNNTLTLSNKTIALGSNTVSGTIAQFNSALTDGDFATLAGSETLTNKTIAFGSNTITTTLAQLNTAVTDADIASLAGSETLTNKTLTAPIVTYSINAVTSAAYTSVATDAAAIVTMNNASANTFSIPTNASVGYAIGSTITIIQIGAGATTINAVSSGTTTIASTGATPAAPVLRAQYSSATCIKVATDTWYVVGDIT